MPRWKQTGTGPGEVVGEGRVTFYLNDDNQIYGCSVEWTGDSSFIPFLPGIAFDQYFPNLREILSDGQLRRAKDAQRYVLADFEAWINRAIELLAAHEPPARFDTVAVADPIREYPIGAKAAFVVRQNEKHERLWSETAYSSKQAEQSLFGVMYRVLWDWAVESSTMATQEQMLTALNSQFAYYATNGIPSDSLMRGIGKAPFTALHALR